MVFSSIPFLYYFLPAVLAVYFLTPRKGKNAVLLLASLIFYGWGELRLLPLMAFTILLCYVCGLGIERSRKRKKLWLLASIVISVGLLGVFKYADFFIGSLNAVTGLKIPLLHLALPVGISFYTFQCLSYTIDVYRGSVPAQKNLINFGAYVALFPQLIAGPIVRYADIARELEHREHSWENAAVGLRRFLVGLGKKVILADNFALLIRLFRQSGEKSVLFYWMYAVAFALNIYFDFSGYSDMAIGLGRVLGFHFVENFNYPYLSRSVTEFWRRWHISLGSWFRDYVYIPMGGSRVSRWRWVLNILTVWMLTGLWHGAAWNFVLWGLLFAALLLAEKWIPVLQRLPGVLRHGYVLLAVVLSFRPVQRGQSCPGGAGLCRTVRLRQPEPDLRRNAVLPQKLRRPVRAGHSRLHAGGEKRGAAHGRDEGGRRAGSRGNAGAADRLHGLSGGRLLQPVPVFPVLKGAAV